MRNIGRVSRSWLHQIEIYSLDELRTCGSIRVYCMIKSLQPEASLNLLWALEGAILDIDWRDIPDKRKSELLSQLNN